MSRYIFKVVFIWVSVISTLVATDENISSSETIKLQLQWKHQFESAGFYAAKEKGFYKEVGLDVEFIEFNSKNIVDEVLNGNADYGLSYSSLIADYMQGKPIVFLANFFKQSPLVLVTQKDIHTPQDLKEKKVMGLLDSTHKQIFLEMLEKYNVTSDDFINVSRKFSIKSFTNKEVDAVSVFTTNEIYTLNELGVQYNILDPAAYGTKFYDANLFTSKDELQNHPQRVEKFRQASIKGWKYALEHKEELVDIIKKKYNVQNKSKEALLFEADQIEYLMLTNIYPIGSIDLERVKVISDSFAQTLMMQKFSREQLDSFIYKYNKDSFGLFDNQKKYLQKKQVLKMCVDPSWMPLEKIENGKHIGVAADFMNIISNKIDTPIQLIQTNSWTQSLKKVRQRECDFLALSERTPKREEYLNFTPPYVKVPLALVTKQGMAFSNDLYRLQNKVLGIVKNYSKGELLQIKFPNIKLLEVDSIQEGLEYVDQEKIFGFLDNSMVLNHAIQKNRMNDTIAITGQFPESFYLCIASRNDEPILNEIFEKALLSIDNRTRETIFNKWNNIKYQVTIDYKLITQIVFFGLLLISIFIYWNFKLKEEIKNKELAQKKLKESEEKFRVLFDIAPVLLDAFDENGKIVLWNKECEKVFGWSYEELKNVINPLELFYPDKEKQKEVIESFSKNEYKEWNPRTKNGDILSTVWANVKLPNGEVINLGYDLTQQRKDEYIIQQKTEQLQKAKQQLEELNDSLEKRVEDEIQKNTEHQVMLMHQSKLAQMGEMIENIAHQWRQPLAQINSSVIVLDTHLEKYNIEDETIEEKLSQIESLTAYMSKTIDDFKNFFHPNKNKKLFKIKDAIEKSYDIVKGRLKILDIEIIFSIQKDLKCNSYMYELQQVILTLLNNAIDAVESKKIEKPQIIVTAKELQNDISISIQDNALGIDEKIIDKVFEPYFTTKHKSQGTGLGLYMAKMIVESGFSGNLSVINKKEGACFTIQIPKGES
jgi:PAS domain S-box-containing protein